MGTPATTGSDKVTLRAIGQRIDRGLGRVTSRIAPSAPTPSAATRSMEEQLTELRGQVKALQDKSRSLELLLAGDGRGMARMPSPNNLAALANEIAAITGDPEGAKRNAYCAFRLLVALESLGVGRIAGGTMNICGKLATIAMLEVPNDEILEIGTLYGLFAAAQLRMLERVGRDPNLTVVDPLIGTQHQSGATMRPDASGTPVREAAVRTNLSLAGAAGARARVHVGYSTDPEVQAAVSDRQYGAIIVDGDHSKEGVAADLVWVEKIVAPGGIVVLDDFGDPRWAGVQSALEEHLAAGSRLTLLGRAATSGFLRAN